MEQNHEIISVIQNKNFKFDIKRKNRKLPARILNIMELHVKSVVLVCFISYNRQDISDETFV